MGHKQPNIERIIDDIDASGLAIWYQDDGRLKKIKNKNSTNRKKPNRYNVYLHTNGFTKEEVKRLAIALSKKFGLKFSLDMVGRNKQYAILRLSRHHNEKWFDLIRNYIEPSLSYKIIGNSSWSWVHSPATVATEPVVKIEEFIPKNKREFAKCYDIEVSGMHNFFARNGKGFINVENCTSRQTHPTQLVADAGLPCQAVTNVIINLRTNPIRISNTSAATDEQCYTGNYWEAKEIGWEDVAKQAGYNNFDEFVEEYKYAMMTSVTKKVRRIFEFPVERIKYVNALAGGLLSDTHLLYSLNFINFVDRTVTGKTLPSEVLTPKVINWLETNMSPILNHSNRPDHTTRFPGLCWLRTGPKHSQIVEL